MSDLAIPSWRTRQERGGPSWRMLAIAGGLLGAVALGGAAVWGVTRLSTPRTVPVIEPDTRPVKVKPGDPGGLVVPNQDQLVLEPAQVRRAAERNQGANARLDQGPEAPALDALRRQATPAPLPPPAAPAPATPAPAATAPAPPPAAAPARPGTTTAAAPGSALVAPALPPPAAPEAAPRPTLAPVPNGRAAVILGALPTEEAARAEWDRLARRVPELAAFRPSFARVERGEGQAPTFRIRAAGLADAAAARALCDAVKAKGGACMPSGG